MGRRNTSIFAEVDLELLLSVIDQSSTIGEVVSYFGHSHWNSRKAFFSRCEEEGIDLSPLRERAKTKMKVGLKDFEAKYSLDEILIEHSPYKNRGHIKRKLIKGGLLQELCSECGLGTEWKGKPLVLVLDHINGVGDDYRIENLRLLCPNCNSQTDTFAGRNVSFCGCGLRISKWSKSGLCRLCSSKVQGQLQKSRSKKPPVEELRELRNSLSREAVGRQFGVSGNTVKKWEIAYGITELLPDGRSL